MSRFVCPVCGVSSTHPKDAEYGFCGACHAYTGDQTVIQVDGRPEGPGRILCPVCGARVHGITGLAEAQVYDFGNRAVVATFEGRVLTMSPCGHDAAAMAIRYAGEPLTHPRTPPPTTRRSS
jgi:rubredoxin